MHEQILTLAMGIAGAGEADQKLLTALCTAAETAWSVRLRQGITADDCGEAFWVSAAFTAAADFLSGQGGARTAPGPPPCGRQQSG